MMKNNGFTLLELIIVMLLITIILGFSTVFFANILPSNKFNASVRDIAATIRHARHLAQAKGENQIIIIDLDSKKYGIEHLPEKNIPSGIDIKILDPESSEITHGKYQLVFHAIGGVEGSTIVLWNKKKIVNIQIDPVAGSIIIKDKIEKE